MNGVCGAAELYKNIELRCEERGISIARLERESGLGNATVRGWVKSYPRMDSLAKVANYLKVDINDLVKSSG